MSRFRGPSRLKSFRVSAILALAAFGTAVDGGSPAPDEAAWLEPAARCPRDTYALDACWQVVRKAWPIPGRPVIVAGAQAVGDRLTLQVELQSSDEVSVLARSGPLAVAGDAFWRLGEVSVDTARYDVTSRQRAFGVRLHKVTSGTGFETTSTTLVLLLPERDRLRPLLELEVEYETLPIREGSASGASTTVRVLPGSGPNLRDLEVTTIKRDDEQAPRTVRRILRWMDDAYREISPGR